MGFLSSIFSKDKTANCDWAVIHQKASFLLFSHYKLDPEKLFSGIPRLMLQKDLNLAIYNDERNPKYYWGFQDKTLVFLKTDLKKWEDWRDILQSPLISDENKKFATMDFCEFLVTCLYTNIELGLLASPTSSKG